MRTCVFFFAFLAALTAARGNAQTGDALKDMPFVTLESGLTHFRPDRNSCAELAAYFILNDGTDGEYPFEDISKEFADKFGERPYSLLNLEEIFLQKGLKCSAAKLKEPSDVFNLDFRHLVLYIPPQGADPIGHFLYCRRISEGGYAILDPAAANPVRPKKLTPEYLNRKKWDGILIFIE